MAGLKNSGKASACHPTTGTPRVSSHSSVRSRSRIDFAPEQITATGCPGKLLQVGRYIAGLAAVHPADAPGGEDADAGGVGQRHRRRNRRPAGPAQSSCCRQIPPVQLPHLGVAAYLLQRRRFEPDDEAAVDDGDGCRCGAGVADDALQFDGGLEVEGPRQAVREDGRLESDHRAMRRRQPAPRRAGGRRGREPGPARARSGASAVRHKVVRGKGRARPSRAFVNVSAAAQAPSRTDSSRADSIEQVRTGRRPFGRRRRRSNRWSPS